MIDTIGFYAPLDRESYNKLTSQGILTQRVDLSSGCIEFEYINNSLPAPSHNYSIRVSCREDMFMYDPALKKTLKERVQPYIKIEYSVPKYLLGHNLSSVSWDGVYSSIEMIRKDLKALSVKLPSKKYIYLYRLDLCANYFLDAFEQCSNYVNYLSKFNYPRRKIRFYENESIYISGKRTTFKIYVKGAEFKKNDRRRIIDSKGEVKAYNLQKTADKILRVESELKTILKEFCIECQKITAHKKVFNTFNGYMCIDDLMNFVNVKTEYNKFVNKFLCGMETKSMKTKDVYDLLKANFSLRCASNYFGIYMLLVLHGQKAAKRSTSKATYYRVTKIFRELGISIVNVDVKKIEDVERGFPSDFSLFISDDNKYYQLPLAA